HGPVALLHHRPRDLLLRDARHLGHARDAITNVAGMALLRLTLPRPLPGCALEHAGHYTRDAAWPVAATHHSVPALSPLSTIELLPRSRYCTWAEARCTVQITGSLALTRSSASMFSSPCPVLPKVRNGLSMPTLQLTPATNLRATGPARGVNPD